MIKRLIAINVITSALLMIVHQNITKAEGREGVAILCTNKHWGTDSAMSTPKFNVMSPLC